VLIQWIGIHEWRSAGSTEKLCLQGFGKRETGGTNGNSGDIVERLLAEAAVIRENSVEKGA
jgi:hypothetical protein